MTTPKEDQFNQRLNDVLKKIGHTSGRGTKLHLELPDCKTVKQAYLKEKSPQQICLEVHPADTLTQAKEFYTRSGAASSVLLLRDKRWDVVPDFHFGLRVQGVLRTEVAATIKLYVDYWRENIKRTGAKKREEWEEFWRELVEQKFATKNDKEKFDKVFTNTNTRLPAAPRPGLTCSYCWGWSDPEFSDDRKLVAAVAEKLNDLLRALGEKPHEPPKNQDSSIMG
jgi:hypothetical protein